MIWRWLMVRALLCLCFLLPFAAHGQQPDMAPVSVSAELQQRLALDDAPLLAVRDDLADCEEGCITPGEAVALAFAAGEGESTPGRFLLDVRGGGQSVDGELEDLFFVNSRQGYARYGTLTIAFETQALLDLLRRPDACGGGLINGRIEVQGCRKNAQFDLNMFTMMQRLNAKRLVVDGEVRLQWIDSALGTPRSTGGRPGYYQVWVRVDDADQVTIVYN